MYEKLAVLNDDDYHCVGVSLEDYTFYEYFPFGNLHFKKFKDTNSQQCHPCNVSPAVASSLLLDDNPLISSEPVVHTADNGIYKLFRHRC